MLSNKESFTKMSRRKSHFGGILLRTIILDFPLFVLFALYLSAKLARIVHDEYLIPLLPLVNFGIDRELTYYYRHCTEKDVSATSTAELITTDDLTPEEAVEKVLRHGGTVLPNLLSPETIAELRTYIMEQNQIVPTFDHIISAENRHTWGILVDDPVVVKASRELFTNPRFRAIMHALAGDDPNVLEFNHITAYYGAESQFIHEDITWGTPLRFVRNYISHYSLFIPLQNTTAKMGATGICPGSHVCSSGNLHYCHEAGWQTFEDEEFWPAGWGWLYDQQLTHNGGAHTDPDASERVLLIMTFTPRPRYGKDKRTLQTRFIAEGGADFMDWTQWGHTFNDYADPPTRMMRPFRFFKSMGIFKLPWTNWGWDFVHNAIGRISNYQPGWQLHDYHKWIEDGGFFFLPMFLHGDISDDNDTSSLWAEFAQSTCDKCMSFFGLLYLVVLGLYVVSSMGSNGYLYFLKRRKFSELTISRTLFRLLLLHGLMIWLYLYIQRSLENSSWGHHIKKQTLYQVSNRRGMYDSPGTLPTTMDVLVPEDFQSEYLYGVSRFLDVAHPGNRRFNDMVSNYAKGFDKLPLSLQQQLESDIVMWNLEEGGRVLSKNVYGQWTNLPSKLAGQFTRKELFKRANPHAGYVIQWSDYLLSETKYGFWRETAMHDLHVPVLLRKLQDRFLQLSSKNGKLGESLLTMRRAVSRSSNFVGVRSMLAGLPSYAAIPRNIVYSSGKPPHATISEPYSAAWASVGDLIEAKYRSETGDWFRGVITNVYAENAQWEITYEDGDLDERTCKRCIRRFVPYKEREETVFIDEEGNDNEAKVLRVRDELTYDVMLTETGQILTKVDVAHLHRVEDPSPDIKVGTFVIWQDESSARVLRINDDGTYYIVDERSNWWDNIDPDEVAYDFNWYKMVGEDS